MKKFYLILILILICFFIIYPLYFSSLFHNQEKISYSGDISGRNHLNTIILLGDTQRKSFWEFFKEDNGNISTYIFDKIASENPAFIIHLGDLIFNSANPYHWKNFDKSAKSIRKKGIPLFPILGNHEYYGFNKIALNNYFSHFPYYKNAQWNSLRFNDIGFILLNSNFDDMTKQEIEKQNSWYKAKLKELQQDSTISMIIIACHHPPYTNSMDVNDSKEVHYHFVNPLINIPKAKLFFSGHCHSYEHFLKNNIHFIVSGGGGGPRQKLITDSTEIRHKDHYKGGKFRKFHYCQLIISNNGILLQMININSDTGKWHVGDEFFINY
jgi:Icc-related predicted phosphoesterase